ncbi:MAG TPA: hypothetical protein VFL91_01035 [Thermomicrobiales bacterium]|nr:hypothetical protein [Thermomicrobiales bacterium]
MNSAITQAAFRIGIFLIVAAGGLLFFLQPGSAEFSITVVTLLIGFIFVGLVVLLLRVVGR